MRRTRFMSLCFMVLSLAFLGVREFRWALEAPILGAASGWWIGRGPLSPERLKNFARQAEQRGDAAALGFVALHLQPGMEAAAEPAGNAQALEARLRERVAVFSQAADLAEKAVALDARLTWLYAMVAFNHRPLWVQAEVASRIERWVPQLQAADPDNVLPWLFAADLHSTRRGTDWPVRNGPLRSFLDALTKESAWCETMATAFGKPVYESYARERFELDRAILRAHDWATPGVVYFSIASYPLPDLMSLRQYASLVLHKLGPEAEHAGRMQKALDLYWGVAHFGERMRLQAHWLVDQIVGQTLQVEAYERLQPLLKRVGQTHTLPTLEFARGELRRQQDVLRGRVPLEQTSNFNWSMVLVHVVAGLLVLFGLFTLICTGYVNAKRFIRPEKRGPLYHFLTVAENYAPIILFASCLTLYLSYYPYAQNFHYYMRAEGPLYQMETLDENIFPSYFVEVPTALPVTNPFGAYSWYALAGVALLTVVALRGRRRARPA